MSDAPITPRDFFAGVTVVQLGDYRVARGLARRSSSSCPHHQMVYDNRERRVWCQDCETNVDLFDAFISLIEPYDYAVKRLEARYKEVAEAEQFQVRSRAAKAIDKAWRSRTTVPCCPHCHRGLFPEDFANGVREALGRDYAERRRSSDQKP